MKRSAHTKCAGVFALAVLAWATAAPARILHVDDDGKADFQSIAEAVRAANTGDVIVVEPGLYAGALDVSGRVLTIRGQDPNDPKVVAGTVIDCALAGGYFLGGAYGAPARANTRMTVAGLTIRNASLSAVLAEEADLTLINCTFTNCASDWAGGALNCADSRVQLTGCMFSANASRGVRGAAIFCSASRLDLTGCTFVNNKGCAVVNYDSLLNLTDCTFQKNSGEDGGAIHSRKDTPGDVVPGLNLTRCTFSENSASASGGAVYSYYIRENLKSCLFSSNRADRDGGALYNSSAAVSVANCEFFGNIAGGTGGALSCWYGSSAQILNCTFTGNSAATGGAVAGNGLSPIVISHSILWGNSAPQGNNVGLSANVFDYGGIASASVEYSDVAGGQKSVYVAPGAVLNWADTNLDTDPLFVSVRDRSLKGTSPCIDAGDPGYAPDSSVRDLAGNPRRSGTTVDLGAYEAGPTAVYRFWSPLTLRHFYTASRGERDKLINEYQYAWDYEGIAFYASSRPFADMLPLYRFWSPKQSSHLWTTDEKEANRMRLELADQWIYEGVGYYVYPPYKQPWGTVPVYRFWWEQRGGHFYTASDEERDEFLKSAKGTWTYEGIVWYAVSGPNGSPGPIR